MFLLQQCINIVSFHFILDLSEPIDIYSEWVDAINERETKKTLKKTRL